MNVTVAMQMDAGDGDRQLVETRLAAHLIEPGQWPLEGDRSGQRRFAAQALQMGHGLEERAMLNRENSSWA